MSVDWAHTAGATEGRAHKARRLAEWCWPRAITGDDLAGFDAATRRELARKAGVRPPSGETVQAAAELLDRRAAWAAEHRDDPRAQQLDADERAEWMGLPPATPQPPTEVDGVTDQRDGAGRDGDAGGYSGECEHGDLLRSLVPSLASSRGDLARRAGPPP